MTNSIQLKHKISEMGYSLASLSKILGISYSSLQRKINGLSEFKLSEMERICDTLEIAKEDVCDYFFI